MKTRFLLLGAAAGRLAGPLQEAGFEVTARPHAPALRDAARLAAQLRARVVVLAADGLAAGPGGAGAGPAASSAARSEAELDPWGAAWTRAAGETAAGGAPVLCWVAAPGEDGAAADALGADALWDAAGAEGGRGEARTMAAARAAARAATRRARAGAEASRERERVESLAYAVAHDVKGRLQGVVGLAGLVAEVEGPRLSAEGRDWVRRIEASGAALGRTLERMLLFLRVDRRASAPARPDGPVAGPGDDHAGGGHPVVSLERGSLDWEALVRERFLRAQAALGPSAQAATLTVRVLDEGAAGGGEEGLLTLALDELLDNALRHGGEGGSRAVAVTVTVAREAEGEGGGWVLTVEDDGPGIPPSLGARALEPLERGPGGGDGLGLALVARVAARLGGGVTLERARPEPPGGAPGGRAMGCRVTLRGRPAAR